MAFSLQEALEQIRSDKIKDRQQGLEALEHIFSDPDNVQNLDPKQDGRPWLKTFQALFACVLAEKAACIRKGSFLDAQPIALARLQRAAQMLRSLVEEAAPLLTRKVVKAILTHILQMLNHRGSLLRPIAPAYMSALCAILKHQHHVDHLDPEDWQDAASLCFSILLGRDLDASVALHDPTEWLASLPASPSAFPQQRGLSLEDAVTAECLCHLMKCNVAPLLGPENHGLSLLADYTRFLLAFPAESSAHLPAMTGLVTLLEHLELNHTREVIFASLSSRQTVLALWKTKNHLLKVQLLLFLRIIVPLLTSHATGQSEVAPPQDPASYASTRSEATFFLELIHEALLRDPDTRWALDPIKMDALVFHWPLREEGASSRSVSALSNPAFYLGPYSSEQDSTAWCRIYLQVDMTDALTTLEAGQHEYGTPAATMNRQVEQSEAPPSSAVSQRSSLRSRSSSNGKRGTNLTSSSPQKRRRTSPAEAIGNTDRSYVSKLIEMISMAGSTPNTGAAARLCALQLLTFVLLTRPALVDSHLVKVREVLLVLAADTDNLLVTWSLVGLAAATLTSRLADIGDSSLGSQFAHPNLHAWGIAVRKLQFPETCRPAAFLLSVLLTSAKLSDTILQPEISRLVAEVDLQGPPILCDAVCHLMTLLLHRTTSNRTYQHLDARRKMGAWFASSYSPADAFRLSTQLAGGRVVNVFLPYHDLLRLVGCIIADREPDSNNLHNTIMRTDSVTEMLRRRARVEPLRELTLQSKARQAPTATSDSHTHEEEAAVSLLSPEAFNRMSIVLDKKIEACLAVLDSSTSENGAVPTIPYQAAIALMHAAILSIDVLSRVTSPSSSQRISQTKRCCDILIKIIDIASQSRDPLAHGGDLVLQQLSLLDPFNHPDARPDNTSTGLLAFPSMASGIASRLDSAQTTRRLEKPSSANEEDRSKRLWQAIQEARNLEAILSSCEQLLARILFGQEGLDSESASVTAGKRDTFDDLPESSSSVSSRGNKTRSIVAIDPTESVITTAVHLLAGVPRMLSGNANSTRDESIVSLFLDCPIQALISLAPAVFDSLHRGHLWISQRDLVDALDRIGTDLLPSYQFARDPAARVAAVRAVTAVVPLLLEQFDEQSDLFSQVQTLGIFFADQIGRTKWSTPWEVQLSCATFLEMCLKTDPDGRLSRSGSARASGFAPQRSLLFINADADIRVRGLGSSIAASVFDTASSDEDRLSQLYTDFCDGLPSDSAIPQHILTRALSLSNVAIANSAVRRSALFHLLEIVLATNMFTTTVQHLFAQIASGLGFPNASTCYQAFAAQITWGMATNNYDPLQVPWKVLGFASKRDCLEATFAASGSMLLAAQTPEGRTQFDALVQLTRRTQQQGLQECLPFLTAAYLGFAVQAAQQQRRLDLSVIGAQTLRELAQLGFAQSNNHKELRCMIASVDDLIVTTLLTLFFEPAATLAESRRSAITALTQQDSNAGRTLSTLTPTADSSTLIVHEPSRPFFASAILCAAFAAMPNLGLVPFRKDVVYNVLRHMFHHIASSRFQNDQLRLCAALRIYIAMCGDGFWADQLNAQTLIKSIELLLGQRHLHDDFRPLLAYACNHSTLAQHCPNVLVSCIITWSVEVADQLAELPASGDWLLETARAVAMSSPVATSATVLLWPVKVTSTEQIAIESVIDIDTLTFAIEACPRISLQLPSLLRIRNVFRKTDKARMEAFCGRVTWKLLRRMADCHIAEFSRMDGDSPSDVISDIYASIASVGEPALVQRKDDRGDESGDSVQKACGAYLAAVDTSLASHLAIAAMIVIHELARTLPLEPAYQAFETLRSIAALETAGRQYPGPLSCVFTSDFPSSPRDELERIRPSIGSMAMLADPFRPDSLLDPSLLDASTSSEVWICRVSAIMCEAIASIARQLTFRPVGRFVATNPTAAKALFHVLLLCFTAANIDPTTAEPSSNGKKKSAGRRSDPREQPFTLELCRAAIATHFEQVLNAKASDPACSSIIIQALLSVRSFRPVQEEPDKVCYWFNVDTSLLAKRCIACGLYSAAIFFVEHGSWEQDESQASFAPQSQNRTELLHQAYTNIDDPDAFYGITGGDVRELLLKRLHHEGQWLRAFQYHAADYEASNADGANAAHAQGQALAQSLSLLGFRHLVQGVNPSSDALDGRDQTAAVGSDSTSWDLPREANPTLRADRVESVLRTLRQASAEQDVDRPLLMALQSQLQSLCSIPSESVAALRKLQGELLALVQIKDWRKASASLGPEEAVVHLRSVWTRANTSDHFEVTEKVLNTRQSLLQAARQRMQSNQIGDVLDGPAEQVARVERLLLVHLSRQAREHEKLQKAINAAAQAERIESILGDGANLAREEFAAVLWDQKEHPPAIQLLSQIVDGLAVTTQSSVQQKRRGARLLALLAQWRGTARSQHPREIDRSLFEPALKLLATNSTSDVAKEASASAELSEIAYQWARFAEEHHRGSDLAEITRLRLYIKSRADEIDQNKREYDRTSSKTERGRLLQFQRQAEKILRQDQTRLTELEASRTHFLRRSVAMYARALSSSDAHDDAVARLVSLWFENAEDAELNCLLAGCLSSIPSRKFVVLMHQLSARLTEVPDQNDLMAPFQSNLTQLLLRMCQDHPFHCLYAIFGLIKTGADAKAAMQRSSSRNSSAPSDDSPGSLTPQILRSTAAEKIWNQIKRQTSLGKRIRTFEELCLAYVEWAEFDLTSRPDRYFQSSGAIKKGALRMPPSGELRLARMRDLAVPVATARLEIDPTCKYESFVSIVRYSETFTTAGGIHLPKISECIGSDGKRYKQLFKRDDDLRQDAVMQQVFRMVNDLLRAERRTRERKLAIRTYTVLPLGPQCGMLEFVTNTVPLGEVLIALHARYRPHDMTPTQARSKMRDVQPLPAEAKLEAFLDVCEQMRPAFRYFFSDAQRMPRDWYETRLRYTRSVSTNSIVGHVLGLGDRHVSNILLDRESGELVHIDFGVAFDQGKLLPIPELVPFRLTRDLVDGMGVHGVEGTFRRCCEETLRVLRAHQDVIKTVLEVFRHDPLFAWTSNPIKVLRAQEADESCLPAASVERSGGSRSTPAPTPTAAQARASRSATPFGVGGEAAGIVGTDTAELSADRAVSSVMSKLSWSLSVEYTVNDLIQQAMDAGNLSSIFHGWQAAL